MLPQQGAARSAQAASGRGSDRQCGHGQLIRAKHAQPKDAPASLGSGRRWPDRRPAAAGRAARPAQAGAAPSSPSERMRPRLPYGVQSGDLAGDRAIVWARADRPARMMVEWATTESFRDARLVRGPAALEDSDFTAKIDLAGLPPGRARVLPRRDGRSRRPQARERAGGRQLLDAACGPARRPLRLVGRHRRAGLGHQPRLGRHEDLRDHAPGRARVLHPFGRHDLRRRADRGRAGDAGRRHLAEPHHRGEGQGRRDARRVPRQLRLQPDGRARPPLQRRGADARPVGRPRGHQQLVPARGSRRRSRTRRPTRRPASICWRRAARARSSSTCRCAGIRSIRSGSTRRSATAPRSTCSGSTCAPIAGPTPRTIRPSRAPTRRSSAPSRSAG